MQKISFRYLAFHSNTAHGTLRSLKPATTFNTGMLTGGGPEAGTRGDSLPAE